LKIAVGGQEGAADVAMDSLKEAGGSVSGQLGKGGVADVGMGAYFARGVV
jgi:hypothetical protein